MKIRSITCFYNPSSSKSDQVLRDFRYLCEELTENLNKFDLEVQTKRIATVPFPHLLPELTKNAAIEFAQRVEAETVKNDFTFTSLGPAIPSLPESYDLVPAMLEATQNIFFDGVIAAQEIGVSPQAIRKCADIIYQATSITEDGFTNLRFAALANVNPFTPFFPSAYSEGAEPAFSLAIESADVAVNTFSSAKSLSSARKGLLDKLESNAQIITKISKTLSKKYTIPFKGLDISLAPFPGMVCSLGKAIELIGPQEIGLSGSLAAAAFIADTLDQGNWQKVGFNGLMLPVLEDTHLANRTSTGNLTIKDLLLYSAVCGTGLDTVPLPGNATREQIECVLLDVASLSTRLNKPLTARLMPIPGKSAGEMTEFKFDYFSNGRILELPAKPLSGLMVSNENFKLEPRSIRLSK